jgi:hypothetical protein
MYVYYLKRRVVAVGKKNDQKGEISFLVRNIAPGWRVSSGILHGCDLEK